MSEFRYAFERGTVQLPFDLDAAIAAFSTLQKRMIRERPESFTRDEWAYLISFVDETNLRAAFTDAFGARVPRAGAARIMRPRGAVAVWLPNNVSLLGPLTLILLSLTGNDIRVKAGARAEDLASEFMSFAALPFAERIRIEKFDRTDPRNADLARAADVRIAFGTDDAMRAIDALPHPPGSDGFYFGDRASEAWLDAKRIDDQTVLTLAKVFAIYGRTGCTSPRRAVIVGGSQQDSLHLRDRLAAVWPQVVTRDVPMHVASQNVMAWQWAAAVGWQAHTTPRNAATLAAGDITLSIPDSPFLLTIVGATLDQAADTLPPNIQTVGHNFDDAGIIAPILAARGAKRIVPLAAMHHFGTVWDGHPWWQATFEEVEVRP